MLNIRKRLCVRFWQESLTSWASHSKLTLPKSGVSLVSPLLLYAATDRVLHSVARVVAVLVHAEFLNLSVSENGQVEDTLSEREMHDCLVTYLNYTNIDADIAESWNLRRKAHEAFAKLKKSTESAVRKNGRVGGLIGNFFCCASCSEGYFESHRTEVDPGPS